MFKCFGVNNKAALINIFGKKGHSGESAENDPPTLQLRSALQSAWRFSSHLFWLRLVTLLLWFTPTPPTPTSFPAAAGSCFLHKLAGEHSGAR